jgi:hypothetical protein
MQPVTTHIPSPPSQPFSNILHEFFQLIVVIPVSSSPVDDNLLLVLLLLLCYRSQNLLALPSPFVVIDRFAQAL